MKKLYRSRTNAIFTGFLGGVGEYFDIDPVVARIVFVVLVIATGFFPGVLMYIVAPFIVPLPQSGMNPIRDAEVVGEHPHS